jgi:hypothetical protein
MTRLTKQKKEWPLYFGGGRCSGKSPNGGSGSDSRRSRSDRFDQEAPVNASMLANGAA